MSKRLNNKPPAKVKTMLYYTQSHFTLSQDEIRKPTTL